MSEISSIKPASVNFSGKKENAEDAKQPKQKPLAGVGSKIFKPIQDDFNKKYDGAAPNAELAADYAADKFIKAGVGIASVAILFTRTKNISSGLMKGVKALFKKTAPEAGKAVEQAIEGGFKARVKDAIKVARKSINDLQHATTDANIEAKGTKFGNIKNVIENALSAKTKNKEGEYVLKEFNKSGKLAEVIKKIFPKSAEKIMNFLPRIGITGAESAITTGAAVVATGAMSKGTNNIADDVVTTDDSQLSTAAKLQSVEKTLGIIGNVVDQF